MGFTHIYTLRLRANKKQLENTIIERTSEAIVQREVAEKARHDISLLSEMGRQITASLEKQSIQNNLYRFVKELIPGNTFGLGLLDWDKRIILFDFVLENGKPVKVYQRSLDASEQPSVQCAMHAKELLINDLNLDTRELDSVVRVEANATTIVQRDGSNSPMPKSAIYVPMMLQEKVIGIISVQSEFANTYHENDLVILRSLGAFAAVAFDNPEQAGRTRETRGTWFYRCRRSA
jgi:transcriptional regulator with GAF, ATPase, and Fis domain